ncbi:MAG TPA: hypothetical protein VFI31_18280 [Pirellulales bacterium]|nr:hypothetical protein [Pirellulales bacterium]
MTRLMRSGHNSRDISSWSRLLRPVAQASSLVNAVSAGKSRQSKKGRRNRRPLSARKTFVQSLEPRVVLDAMAWIGGSGNWGDPTHWVDNTAPGNHATPQSDDTVSIGTGTTAATITIKSGDGITILSLTTGANDTLSITGGSLTVTSGISTLSGPLDMTGGSLEANGKSVTLTADSATTVSQANLYAENGGVLSFPNLTSSVSNGTFEANGAASVLDVSDLTTVTQAGGWTVNAYNGGLLKLSGLTSLNSTQGISINDTGGSTLLDTKLTTLKGVNVSLDGTDPHVADTWTEFANGHLTVYGNASGTGYSLSGLTDVDGSSLDAENGGQLALPNLTSYASNGTFEANGTNAATNAPSLLDVSALTTLTQSGGWTVNAYHGGLLNLSGLTSLNSTQGIAINNTGGSTLLDAKLTTLNGVNVSLDGTDPHVADTWTKFTNGHLTVYGNASDAGYSLAGLTDVDGSSLYAENGGQLALPNLTSYASNGTFEANGANTATTTPSTLDVSALTTLIQSGGWTLNAYNGGLLKLSGLTSLNSTQGIAINDTGGSTLLDAKLTTLKGVNVTLDGTDPHIADTWTEFTTGHLTVYGNASETGYRLAGLTDVDGSSLYAENGGQLALPNLASYAS